MNSFGVRILNEWWEFCAVVGRQEFSIVRRISSRISVLSGGRLGPFQTYIAGVVIYWTRALQKNGLALPDNCHFLSRDIVKFES